MQNLAIFSTLVLTVISIPGYSNENTCDWSGAKCYSYSDCSGDLTCNNGRCGPSPYGAEYHHKDNYYASPDYGSAEKDTCAWSGHCEGAKCYSNNDCFVDLKCSDGRCGSSPYGAEHNHKTYQSANMQYQPKQSGYQSEQKQCQPKQSGYQSEQKQYQPKYSSY